MPYTHPLFSPPLRGFRTLSAVLDDAGAFLDDLEASARAYRIDLTTREETDTAYTFTVALPGFKKADVEIAVEEHAHQVVIAAKRGGVGRVWSQKGDPEMVTRTITLPTDADSTKVEAKLEDGLLRVTVAKVAKPTPPAPRKVTVS